MTPELRLLAFVTASAATQAAAARTRACELAPIATRTIFVRQWLYLAIWRAVASLRWQQQAEVSQAFGEGTGSGVGLMSARDHSSAWPCICRPGVCQQWTMAPNHDDDASDISAT